jgi:hypothetical protein
MKLIDVQGDGDYAAMFIEDEYGVQKAYEEAKANGGYVGIPVDDYDKAHVRVLTFNHVDPAFIDFIRQGQDYDMAKHKNFYIIEGETE